MIDPHRVSRTATAPSLHADVDDQFRRFCRDGDRDALGAVYVAVAPSLVRRAMQRTRDRDAALDLVQATFTIAIENRQRFDATARVRPWLLGILDNLSRRQHARRWPDALPEVDPDVVDDPVDKAIDGETHDLVRRGIAGLPTPYRAVLERALLEQQTAEQIAAELRRPMPTVRSQVRRGLERLRRALPTTMVAMLRAMGLVGRIVRSPVAIAAGVGGAIAIAVAMLVSDRTLTPPVSSTATMTPARMLPQSPSPASTAAGDELPAADLQRSAIEPSALPPPPIRMVVRSVVDAAPRPNVEVEVAWEGGVERALSDAAGHAEFARPVATTSFEVLVSFAAYRQQFAVPASDDEQPLLVELAPGCSLTGQVVDDDGRPVPAAAVMATEGQRELQVALADGDGLFQVLDLNPHLTHRLLARSGERTSAVHELVGAVGTAQQHRFVLDQRKAPPATSEADPKLASSLPSTTAAAAATLTVEFACADGASVHGWLAVLVSPFGVEVLDTASVVGDTARFQAVPTGPLRCALVPDEPHLDAAAMTQVLTRRNTTAPQLLRRDGPRAVLTVTSQELPSAWLRIAATGGGAPLAQRAVVLDAAGRPHGIYDQPERGIGPLRAGTWTVALSAPGRPSELRGPLQVDCYGRYTIADLEARDAGVVQLVGAGDAETAPLEDLWLTACGTLVTLPPRRDVGDDIVLAPGDYVLHWRQRGRACSRSTLTVVSGVQQVELDAPTGSELGLVFDFGANAPALEVAMLAVTVRDAAGLVLWCERRTTPLPADGTLRLSRRFAVPFVSVEAVDVRGMRGVASGPVGGEPLRLVMRPPDQR